MARHPHHRLLAALATGALVTAVVAGCGDDGGPIVVESRSDSDGTAGDATSVPDSAEPTAAETVPATDAASTTAAPTTAAPSTTAAPPPTPPPLTAADLVLRRDGIGPLSFGDRADPVLTTLADVLGVPVEDTPAQYPVAVGDGTFQSPDGELGYTQPFGRFVCFANGLCAQFGGPAVGDLRFTGWVYGEAAGGVALVTAGGIGIGARWADFPAMTVFEGGCYSAGHGEIDGVALWLLSSGVPFSGVDADGNWVTNVPDPADVTVYRMDAGSFELYLFGDC